MLQDDALKKITDLKVMGDDCNLSLAVLTSFGQFKEKYVISI